MSFVNLGGLDMSWILVLQHFADAPPFFEPQRKSPLRCFILGLTVLRNTQWTRIHRWLGIAGEAGPAPAGGRPGSGAPAAGGGGPRWLPLPKIPALIP